MRTEILYEDGDILVVYKPAGIAVQTARVGQPDVVSELKNHLRQPQAYLGVIHRLDQPVEGLLVFAKSRKAAAALSAQLQRQEGDGMFCKRYYALLCGCPAAPEAELTDYLYKDQGNRAVVAQSPEERQEAQKAKKALLRYRVLQTEELQAGETGRIALADIRIVTGRFHQIRAQMAHAGTPLLGDMKYGDAGSTEISQVLGIREVALCAYSLELAHPVSGRAMSFQAAPRGKAFSLFGGYKYQEKTSY